MPRSRRRWCGRRAALLACLLTVAGAGLLPVSNARFTGQTSTASLFVAPNFGTHAQAVLADGAIGFFRLDERLAGADSSPSAAGAAMSGGVTAQVTGAFDTAANKAANFNGSAGAIVPYSSLYTFGGTSPFTVEAWVRPTVVDGSYRAIAQCVNGEVDGTRDGWYVWQQSSNGLGFERFNNGGVSDGAVSPVLTAGVWYQVTVTYDGSVLTVYRNGTPVGAGAGTHVISNRPCTLRIGNSAGATSNWVGDLDEVAVYPGSLSAAQVAAHYANSSSAATYRAAVLAAGATGYWTFDGTQTAFDSSPTGSTATYSEGVYGGITGALSGTVNPAARFDGGGRVLRGYDKVYSFAGYHPFSIEAWIRPTVIDGNFRYIATCYSAQGNRYGWSLWQQSQYGVGFERFVNGSNQGITSGTAATYGVWSHVVATYDGTTMRMYRDGVLTGRSGSSYSIVDDPCQLTIGWIPRYSSDGFYGDLDEISFYPTALTADQVAFLYQRRS